MTDQVQGWVRRLRATGAVPHVRHLSKSDRLAIADFLAALPAVSAPAEDATAKGETPGEMLDRLGMDGVKWAAEFRTTALRLGYSDMDEGWLIGWFCNAIMAGYDRAPVSAPDVAELVEALRDMINGYEVYGYDNEGKPYVLPIDKQSSWIQRARAALTDGAADE